ncbi:hypothetical protein [Paraburkholderia phytofirmans]|uniref:hypothetical protein n=1 Tax=Paraburkholderia phytofirmans TaxID=261302 RepID=UPI0038BD1193
MTFLLRSAGGAIKRYGDDLSHKEIARRMTTSLATVRHCPRCAYKKRRMHVDVREHRGTGSRR